MPASWDQKRIGAPIEMLLEFLEAADLSDADADAMVAILPPKLWQRSGLGCLRILRGGKRGAFIASGLAAVSPRRH